MPNKKPSLGPDTESKLEAARIYLASALQKTSSDNPSTAELIELASSARLKLFGVQNYLKSEHCREIDNLAQTRNTWPSLSQHERQIRLAGALQACLSELGPGEKIATTVRRDVDKLQAASQEAAPAAKPPSAEAQSADSPILATMRIGMNRHLRDVTIAQDDRTGMKSAEESSAEFDALRQELLHAKAKISALSNQISAIMTEYDEQQRSIAGRDLIITLLNAALETQLKSKDASILLRDPPKSPDSLMERHAIPDSARNRAERLLRKFDRLDESKRERDHSSPAPAPVQPQPDPQILQAAPGDDIVGYRPDQPNTEPHYVEENAAIDAYPPLLDASEPASSKQDRKSWRDRL